MRKGSKNCPKRKGEKASETLTDVNGESEGGSKGFFACYLLTSLSPRHKGHTYIGFTVNPKRRIRQHNGEITSGATRTKKKRPWEMILCIYGFPTQVAALQFEWAWQHPTESLAVRKAACNLKSLAGLPNKIKVAFTMLTLHTWQSMDLTVNFFSTKYMSHVAACPSLPRQMKVQFGSMDDLPCYSSDNNQSPHNDEDDWDLDPQECCGSDDGIEDLTLGNEAVANRHCYNATSSFTENQADKEPQRSQEYNVFEPRDSVYLTEENTDAFTENQTDKLELQRSPEHDILEPRDSVFLVEDDDFQKDCYKVDRFDDEHNTPMRACVEKSVVIEDCDCRYVQLSAERSPLARRATDKMQSSTVGQIEVIDLFTPSPDYSKKRKVDSTRSNVIDLTRSPDFVQL